MKPLILTLAGLSALAVAPHVLYEALTSGNGWLVVPATLALAVVTGFIVHRVYIDWKNL